MAGPPNSNWGELTFLFAGSSLPTGAACTLGVVAPEGSPQTYLESIIGGAGDLMNSTSSSACTLTQVNLKIGPVATGPTFSRAASVQGGRSGSAVPPNSAVLVRKAVLGMSTRFAGRLFWPVPAEPDVGGDGIIDPARVVAMQEEWTGFFDVLDGLGTLPVVYDRESSDPRSVSAFEVQAVVATQRRRLRR